MSESYDKECCRQECDCPEGSSIECEDSGSQSNYETLVSLFKSNDEDTHIEASGLNKEQEEEVSDILKTAVDKLNEVLNGHQDSAN